MCADVDSKSMCGKKTGVSLIAACKGGDALLDYLEGIYTEAFPPEERRPWPGVCDGSGPELMAVVRDGVPCGLVSFWRFDDFVYIEHFAVDAARRSGGTGAAVLAAFAQDAAGSLPVVVEVELPESSPEATRRVGFYQRNGFTVATRTYLQPPYAPGLPEVALMLMATGSVDADAVARVLHRRVYGVEE